MHQEVADKRQYSHNGCCDYGRCWSEDSNDCTALMRYICMIQCKPNTIKMQVRTMTTVKILKEHTVYVQNKPGTGEVSNLFHLPATEELNAELQYTVDGLEPR